MYLLKSETDKRCTDCSSANDEQSRDIKVETEISMEHKASYENGATEDEAD